MWGLRTVDSTSYIVKRKCYKIYQVKVYLNFFSSYFKSCCTLICTDIILGVSEEDGWCSWVRLYVAAQSLSTVDWKIKQKRTGKQRERKEYRRDPGKRWHSLHKACLKKHTTVLLISMSYHMYTMVIFSSIPFHSADGLLAFLKNNF